MPNLNVGFLLVGLGIMLGDGGHAAEYPEMDRLIDLSAYYDFTHAYLYQDGYNEAIDITQCVPAGSQPFLLPSGALVWLITKEGGPNIWAFWGCDSGYYESSRNKNDFAMIRYQYPGDPWLLEYFQGFCSACPVLTSNDGTSYAGQITTDYIQHQGKVTDCRIPENREITDSTGTYVFTSDCYYSN